jgi:hypothetical protein
VLESDRLLGHAVHFTRGSNPADAAKALAQPGPSKPSHIELLDWLNAIDDTGYRVSLSILWDGFVRPTFLPLCVGRNVPGLEENHRSACFSETALNELAPLISTRSVYGVGFRQDFLRERGGQRVRYIEPDTDEAERWRNLVRQRLVDGVDHDDPLWRDTPYVDILDPGHDTRWEQEWRVPGGLRFTPGDVAFVFLPAALHDKARRFFTEHRDANTGPAYLGPYLDPRWSRQQIEDALGELGVEPRPGV